jgi:hypothetical protein
MLPGADYSCECGQRIGTLVAHDGRLAVQLEGSKLVVVTIGGVCFECGKKLHYIAPKLLIENDFQLVYNKRG